MTVEELIGTGMVEAIEAKKKKRNVLVAIRIDQNDRLLLNWALVKVAEPGDHVLVLHVCRAGSDMSLQENPSLDGYLAVYKGLCSVKQLDLTGQVSRGGSPRKIIVREAKLCDATVVVVGVNRPNAFGGWLSTARYCAKSLPATTTLLTVHKGKIVYQRGSSKQPPGIRVDSLTSFYPIPSLHLQKTQSCSSVSETSEVEISSPQMVQNFEDASIRSTSISHVSSNSISSSVHEEGEDLSSSVIAEIAKELSDPKPGWPLLKGATLRNIETARESQASCGHVSSSSISSSLDIIDENFNLNEEMEDLSSSAIAELAKGLSDPKPGWPLLKGANRATTENARVPEARKMSVVNWVMSLPKRTLSHKTRSQSVSFQRTSEHTLEADGEKKGIKRSFSVWGVLPKELEFVITTNSSNCEWFNHKELDDATSHFSSGNLIGSGGCSRVYKGYLLDGKPVAVKVLKVSKEAWNDFALEVDITSSLKHKHITPLIGVCLDDDELILVYDFLSKGNLEENLHDRKEKSGLSWEVRFNVALGVAEAINYLHRECPKPVIHRDIKSSNILLSDKFEPQLSDFGLAMWAPTSSSHETHSDVVGTFGYLAPEYFMYGKVSNKIDVYSFGVVLLELLSGRKPISSETPKGQESLVMWAKPILESGDMVSILDPKLDGNFDEDQMRRMVLAVTLCITRKARLRPEMNQIMELLQGEKDMKDWMKSRMNETEEPDYQEGDEAYPDSSAESHLGVALFDVEDTTSVSSVGQNKHHSLEDYLKGRCSRSSSFN